LIVVALDQGKGFNFDGYAVMAVRWRENWVAESIVAEETEKESYWEERPG
jgi:hypothetical protein